VIALGYETTRGFSDLGDLVICAMWKHTNCRWVTG
jgi:hypothetical protein